MQRLSEARESEPDFLANSRRRYRWKAGLMLLAIFGPLVWLAFALHDCLVPEAPFGTHELGRGDVEVPLELTAGEPLSFFVEVELDGDHEVDEGQRAPHAAVLHAELLRGDQVVDSMECPVNRIESCPISQRRFYRSWDCWLDCTLASRSGGAHTLLMRWTRGREWPPEEVERLAVTPEQR